MSLIRCAAMAILATAISGCATAPLPSQATKVDSQYITQPALLDQRPGTGKVTVVREGRPMHSYRTGVYVDGAMVATIAGEEALTVYLPTGRSLIGTGPAAKASVPFREISIDVKEDKPSIVRFRLSAWGWGYPGGWEIEETSW